MLSIRRTSPLYLLASRYGFMGQPKCTDACRLARHALMGLVTSLAITAVCTTLLAGVGDFALWLWFGLTIAWVDLIGPGMILIALTVSFGFVAAAMGLAFVATRCVPQAPGLKYAREIYRGFKEKYCPTITVKE